MPYGSLLADVVKSSTSSPIAFQNTSGTEIGTLCRAWVNFNGTGTVAIRASFNVSSITDNGTGAYTVNFTNAMPDANFACTYGHTRGSSGTIVDSVGEMSRTASTLSVQTGVGTATTNYLTSDAEQVNIAIFR